MVTVVDVTIVVCRWRGVRQSCGRVRNAAAAGGGGDGGCGNGDEIQPPAGSGVGVAMSPWGAVGWEVVVMMVMVILVLVVGRCGDVVRLRGHHGLNTCQTCLGARIVCVRIQGHYRRLILLTVHWDGRPAMPAEIF